MTAAVWAIGGLPNVHPLLVHFPLALFTTALACDAVLVARLRVAWLDRTALLLYGLSALGAGAAAITGKLAADALEPALSPETAAAVASHGDWAFVSVVAAFLVFAARFDACWRDRGAAAPTIHRTRLVGLGLAVLAQLAFVVTAARGGELVYGRGVGVRPGALGVASDGARSAS